MIRRRSLSRQGRGKGFPRTPFLLLFCGLGIASAADASAADASEARDAFRQPDLAVAAEQRLDFQLGDSLFRRLWVQAPSSTAAADGLGPLYNARSCQGCHRRNGRAERPEGATPPAGLLFRSAIPPQDAADRALLEGGRAGVIAEPNYGQQIQPLAVAGLAGEGRLRIEWTEASVTLADGLVVGLRRPAWRFEPGQGAAHPQLQLSARLAPPIIGLGLLEQVPEAAILALADPGDRDGDGIRGRPNRVWSAVQGRTMLGRFGWKASEATIPDQVASAFANDLGLSTPLQPAPWGDCTPLQPACRGAPHGLAPGEATEVAPVLFALSVFHARHVAVPPQRRAAAPEVLAGAAVFQAIGCAACHRPQLTSQPEVGPAQAIRPFTDLLLHDMGEGLADGRSDWQAGGRDWRTAPLWGLGLAAAVGGAAPGLLHDGRARSVLEAILWHGGEAQPARDRVLGLAAGTRAALLAFLDSL